MNITDSDVRDGLSRYANRVHTTRPPIGVITGAALAPVAVTRRPLRRPILGGAIAGGLLVGVGAAAAGGIFNNDTTQFLEATCGLNTADARLVASDTDSRGFVIEFWVIKSPGGGASIIDSKDPAGTYGGGASGCSPGGPAYPAGQPWSQATYTNLDGQPTLIDLYGWIPQPATTAIVTFIDGTTATVTAGPDGYFLHVLTVPANTNVGLAHIEARAEDGTLVAEHQLLG